MTCRLSLPLVLLATLALSPAARAQDGEATAAGAHGATGAPPAPDLEVELNKLEDTEGVCRAYFIVRNRTGGDLTALSLDTFLFDSDGIIVLRLALPFEAIEASGMRIAQFDFDIPCGDIGSAFVNDVITCEGVAPVDCDAALRTTSRAEAPFES